MNNKGIWDIWSNAVFLYLFVIIAFFKEPYIFFPLITYLWD